MKKISLIGAGQIGGALANMLSSSDCIFEVVLLDLNEGVAKGKALDISQSLAYQGKYINILGTSDFSHLKGSDVVIVTAGVPRKPGMTREDLIGINAKIISDVAKKIKEYAPNAFTIIITNPLDAMVKLAHKIISPSKNGMVVGMAGILDTARFKCFLAEAIGVTPSDVNSMVLGGHGDDMVPVENLTSIGGIPLSQFLKQDKSLRTKLDEIIKRTRAGGAEVVGLMGTSAFIAPASSAILMAKSFMFDLKHILPCCVNLRGEYSVSDLCVGVPVIIDKNGASKIIEVELTENEKQMFQKTVSSVKSIVSEIDKIAL